MNYIFIKPYVVLKGCQNMEKLKIDMMHIVRSITLNLLRKRKVFWTNIIVMIVPELCIGGKHYFVVEKLLLYSFKIGKWKWFTWVYNIGIELHCLWCGIVGSLRTNKFKLSPKHVTFCLNRHKLRHF